MMLSDRRNQGSAQALAAARAGSSIRQLSEMLVCLAIAVALFRSFEIEGYMISTGSMAPSLLGYHKLIECPTCRFAFRRGVAFDDAVQGAAAASADTEPEEREHLVECPNCGQNGIDIGSVPRNQGDQLLVQKHAFTMIDPQRWQPVVFRNPQNPSQVYVKRIAGLPGERVRVIDGDVWVNGRIERKSLLDQRALRIPVFDQDFRPRADPNWVPRWVSERGPDGHRWVEQSDGFHFEGGPSNEGAVWLRYRHWYRQGGEHESSVSVDSIPTGFEQLTEQLEAELPFDIVNSRQQFRFESEQQRLVCRGSMTERTKQSLLRLSSDSAWQEAVSNLSEQSHEGWITDQCSYNDPVRERIHVPVYDVMLECEVLVESPGGQLAIEMSDGFRIYTLEFDRSRSEIRLMADSESLPMRVARIEESAWVDPRRVEFSLFDRQVIAALDGVPLFPPLLIPDTWVRQLAPRTPVRIGAKQSRISVRHLKLFRDVHYTRGKARNGIDSEFQLSDTEFFVLGDNSPVSSDSRNWPDGAVPESLLVGRPLILHLPSRPGKVVWGDQIMHFRIPDFSRIRYIR